jgi:hypothetical protein
MKKITACVVVLYLLSTLTACAGAALTSSPSPTSPAPTSTPGLTPDDFGNKVLLGEDDNYSVYMINPAGSVDTTQTGELIVYAKITSQVTKMDGTFSIAGSTVVYNDGKGQYVLLSIGTYTSRFGIVLSLSQAKQAVDKFCMSSGQNGDHLFWNDVIIINNCDTETNRPWGNGEAPSVVAINLKTGTQTMIAQSDQLHQFQVEQVDGNMLHFVETSVSSEADWQSQDKLQTAEKTFDLSTLNK